MLSDGSSCTRASFCCASKLALMAECRNRLPWLIELELLMVLVLMLSIMVAEEEAVNWVCLCALCEQ